MSGINSRPQMTKAEAKVAAKAIKARMDSLNIPMSSAQAYEALAASLNHANWSTMAAAISQPRSTSNSDSPSKQALLYLEGSLGKLRALIKEATDASGAQQNPEAEIRRVTNGFYNAEVKEMLRLEIFSQLFPDFWFEKTIPEGDHIDSAADFIRRKYTIMLKDEYAEAYANVIRLRLSSSLKHALNICEIGGVEDWRDHRSEFYVDKVRKNLWVDDLNEDVFVRNGAAIARSYLLGDWGLRYSLNSIAGLGKLEQVERRRLATRHDCWAKIDRDKDYHAIVLSCFVTLLRHDPQVAMQIFRAERNFVIVN